MIERTHWGPMESLEDPATEADTPDADDVTFVGPVRFDRNMREAQQNAYLQKMSRAALIQRGLDADLLDAQHGQYYTTQINGEDIGHPNFNDDTPAAAAGFSNVSWQVDADGNVSAYVEDCCEPYAEITTEDDDTGSTSLTKVDNSAYDIDLHIVMGVYDSPETPGDPTQGQSAVHKLNYHYDPASSDTISLVNSAIHDVGIPSDPLTPMVQAITVTESAGQFTVQVQSYGGYSGAVTYHWRIWYTLRELPLPVTEGGGGGGGEA